MKFNFYNILKEYCNVHKMELNKIGKKAYLLCRNNHKICSVEYFDSYCDIIKIGLIIPLSGNRKSIPLFGMNEGISLEANKEEIRIIRHYYLSREDIYNIDITLPEIISLVLSEYSTTLHLENQTLYTPFSLN
ncbi:MAG: hypothetical protein D6707_13020 [Bacteroidetes bacterium]|nr:MAG: hypothetical protein D6707_13020 [Bacteroidota bacterium]